MVYLRVVTCIAWAVYLTCLVVKRINSRSVWLTFPTQNKLTIVFWLRIQCHTRNVHGRLTMGSREWYSNVLICLFFLYSKNKLFILVKSYMFYMDYENRSIIGSHVGRYLEFQYEASSVPNVTHRIKPF